MAAGAILRGQKYEYHVGAYNRMSTTNETRMAASRLQRTRVFPISIKGVVISPRDEVVLLLNERDEWELPGGRIELGESSAECLAREILEELSIEIRVGPPVDTYLFEVLPGRHLFIATYRCTVLGPFRPMLGSEHKRVGLFPPDALPPNLPRGYRSSIATVMAERATSA